ncbi:MAG: VOC family protein [Pseudomonadales bacterium]|nr:VOC family protein [Pseudomonadales bacterium]NIX09723.1 VOC family protein [Pseudomonadales bacterium]
MTKAPKPHAGLRHVALFTTTLEACVRFYTELLGMKVEWNPDPDNFYLTSGTDNLALHRATESRSARGQRLDHIGFIIDDEQDVDAWHDHLAANGVNILERPKTHRDGARSFYCEDPDGNVVQFIYHPPISRPSGQTR